MERMTADANLTAARAYSEIQRAARRIRTTHGESDLADLLDTLSHITARVIEGKQSSPSWVSGLRGVMEQEQGEHMERMGRNMDRAIAHAKSISAVF